MQFLAAFLKNRWVRVGGTANQKIKIECKLLPNGVRLAACDLHGIHAGTGVDNAWEQRKLEARKMLEICAESQQPVPDAFSGVRYIIPVYFRDVEDPAKRGCVGRFFASEAVRQYSTYFSTFS